MRWSLLLLAACVATPSVPAQQVESVGQSASAISRTQHKAEEPAARLPASAAFAINDTLKRIATTQESPATCGKPGDENTRECQDLKAQQDMVYWAKLMFYATCLTAALSIIATIFLFRTFRQTRTATLAATEQASAMMNMERAFLMVSEIDLKPVRNAENGSRFYRLAITYKNVGKTVAFVTSTGFKFAVCRATELPQIPVYSQSIDSADRSVGQMFVLAGESFVDESLGMLSITDEDRQRLHFNTDGLFVHAWGEIVYDDLFGGVTEAGFLAFQYPEISAGGTIFHKAAFRFAREPQAYVYQKHTKRNRGAVSS